MIWRGEQEVYKVIMSHNYTPFYYEEGKLYLITSWNFGKYIVDNCKAEGKEILDYGN